MIVTKSGKIIRFNPLKWNIYAGGTSAPNKRSYQVRGDFGAYQIDPIVSRYGRPLGYQVYFADEKGKLGGGLWQSLGKFNSPNAAKKAVNVHFSKHFGGK